MKNTLTTLLLILILSSCSSDDKTKVISEIDKLPPATQIGANKIGCLLDGKAFLPDNRPNSTNSYYQYDNERYYFHISLSHQNSITNAFVGLAVNSNGLEISEGSILYLGEPVQDSPSGFFQNNLYPTHTSSAETGELKITNLTETTVSGTFWYDIIDYEGNLHQIREGRFDMEYSN